MYIPEKLLFLNEEDVLRLLTPADAIAAAEDTFYHIGTGEVTVGKMVMMYADGERRNNFYSNPLPGYPFSHGNLVIVSDVHTGSPIALVGATNITTMRTAGGHGVVQAKHLANPDPRVLSVFGCGAQAKAGIRGFLEGFPSLRQLRLFNRSRQPMEEVQRRLSDRLEVVICDTPEEAVSGSSLILMASGAQSPLLTAEQIRPGTTVIGIEGFRDLDPRLGKSADKWYLGYKAPDTDILNSPLLNPGKTLAMDDVFGDMTELLTGKVPGREREEEIIVSTHMGMGAHDVCCAEIVYQRALERGVGQMLQLT